MKVNLSINGGELLTPEIDFETKLADLLMAAGFPPVPGKYAILDTTVVRRGKVVFTGDVDHMHALQTWGPQNGDSINVTVKEFRPTQGGVVRKQYRRERILASIKTLTGEQSCDATMRTMSILLERTNQCKCSLKMFEEDMDCTSTLRRYIDALHNFLSESECAVLRGFFFTMPKRADRALAEIEERLSLLEFGISELQKHWDRIKEHSREVQHAK
jgi:hypothetical protein